MGKAKADYQSQIVKAGGWDKGIPPHKRRSHLSHLVSSHYQKSDPCLRPHIGSLLIGLGSQTLDTIMFPQGQKTFEKPKQRMNNLRVPKRPKLFMPFYDIR